MLYQRDFDESTLSVCFIIKEYETNKTTNPKCFRFVIDGKSNDDVETPIDFEYNLDKIIGGQYHFDIRTNDENNRLIYSSEWDDDIEPGHYAHVPCNIYDNKGGYDKLAGDINFNYCVINQQYAHTKELNITVEDVCFTFDIDICDGYGYTSRIINLQINYNIHPWLSHVKTYTMGTIGDVPKMDIPEHIRLQLDDPKCNISIANHSFTYLWLYPYYTGDIFLINLEPKSTDPKCKKYQYYIVAHLHIVNNSCGTCNENCICNWTNEDIHMFNTFLKNYSAKLNAFWYETYSTLMLNREPFIVQSNDCCFIDKTIIDDFS